MAFSNQPDTAELRATDVCLLMYSLVSGNCAAGLLTLQISENEAEVIASIAETSVDKIGFFIQNKKSISTDHREGDAGRAHRPSQARSKSGPSTPEAFLKGYKKEDDREVSSRRKEGYHGYDRQVQRVSPHCPDA